MKKCLSFLLALIMLLPLASTAFAEEAGVKVLKINPYGGSEDDIDTVSWFDDNDMYFLFLPSDVDISVSKVYFTASAAVTLDGNVIESGGSASAFTNGNHVVACGDHEYNLTVWASDSVPSVFISTESGSLDYIHQNKENKEPGSIRIYESGKKTLDMDLKHIKGRGNTTWLYPQKPYNIKFDKKTDVFGMGKAKKWSLLAEYYDYTFIHNIYGWEFAKAFGIPYTSEYKNVDLYINGEYMGAYVICESVEVDENRVNINDLEKNNEKANPDIDIEELPQGGTGRGNTAQTYNVKGSRKWIEIPQNPADITGGYLLEYEYGPRYNEELCGFITSNGQPIVIKSPEYASQAQVNYIADFVDEGTEALYSKSGYNSKGRHYSDYFDMESLVNMYILQELSMNFDAALSSFYAYKQKGEDKLVFAPVWDLDNAFGSHSSKLGVPLYSTNVWYANQLGINGIPTVLSAAYSHSEFRNAVRSRWAELYSGGVFEQVNDKITAMISRFATSAALNGIKWNRFVSKIPEVVRRRYFVVAGESVSFVEGRTAQLNKGFGENGTYLYYDLNGAPKSQWILHSEIKELGESITIREYSGNGKILPPDNKVFYCWNTQPDGSGTKYLPGDTYTFEKEENILYAIWKTQQEIDDIIAAEQLAADIAEFEVYKADAAEYITKKAKADDSAAVQKILADAKDTVDNLSFDPSKTLAQNRAILDEILASLDSSVSAQYEAEKTFAEAKSKALSDVNAMAAEGDTDFAAKMISEAYNSLSALDYDSNKTLNENLDVISGIVDSLDASLSALRSAYKTFESAKQNAAAAADGKSKPGDSAYAKNLVFQAKNQINMLSYQDDKTLEQNLAKIDDVLAQLDSDLLAAREADNDVFESFRADALADADSKTMEGDSEASQKLIADAKESLSACKYDENKTLYDNLKVLEDILKKLDSSLAAQRKSDANLCKWCGRQHTGSFGRVVQLLHNIFYLIAHLFGTS